MFNSKIKKISGIVGIVIIAGIGTWIIKNSFASPPAETPSPPAKEVTRCGARVENYTYKVPFGNAVWNQPVCNLPKYSKSEEYASRFYNWGTVNDGSAEQAYLRGRLGLGLDFAKPTPLDPEGTQGIWSRNVYYASDATTTTKVHSHKWASNLDGTRYNGTPLIAREGYSSYNPDTRIPWNPAWSTGRAGDNEIVILDESNGKIYELWGFWKSDLERLARCGVIITSDRICAMSINIGRDVEGNIIDYRTFEGLHGDRGVGFSKFITFTTPSEVVAGEIRHALGITIPNTMYGPPCTTAQLGTSAEGKTCGTALAPAAKLELGVNTTASHLRAPFIQTYTLDKTIPEGTRFALDITIQEINDWISSQERFKNNPRLAETARIFAVALRDYGFMVVDTSGNGPGIQVAGSENPKDKALWNQVGINSQADGSKLLNGLIQKDKLYVVDPPTLTCADGTKSKYFCKWTNASYSRVSASPSVTPAPPEDNASPDITIKSPANGTSVKGVVNIDVTATDNIAVTKTELLINNKLASNQLVRKGATDEYSSSYDASGLPAGSHTLTVRAYDDANKKDEKSITIKVSSPPVPSSKRGDFNNNGSIGLDDLAILMANMNKKVPKNTLGDCDGDGRVTFIDFLILLSESRK